MSFAKLSIIRSTSSRLDNIPHAWWYRLMYSAIIDCLTAGLQSVDAVELATEARNKIPTTTLRFNIVQPHAKKHR